nr:phosphotransferase [Saccharopolyspora rosea]
MGRTRTRGPLAALPRQPGQVPAAPHRPMTPTNAEVAEADRQFTAWMRGNLARAADHFAVTLDGEPVFGWRLRSIGTRVRDASGAGYWLRVVSEFPQWAHGEFWTGNTDANTLPASLPKPYVLGYFEWNERDWRHQRAELSTLLPGDPCSTTDAPTTDLNPSSTWWADLRRTLATLAATPTLRTHADQQRVSRRIHDTFGDHAESHVEQWETVHGDLHWNNLLHPQLGVLDWEGWGRGPAGTDAATLLCSSVLNPTTRRAVRSAFGDVLDTPTGRVAQLYATARLLHRVEMDHRHEFAAALREHASTLLNG